MKTTSTLPPILIISLLRRMSVQWDASLPPDVDAWLAAEEAAQQPPKGHMPWSALSPNDQANIKHTLPWSGWTDAERESRLWVLVSLGFGQHWVATPQVLTASQRHELTSEPGEGES